ncbi:hypothetical protein PENTCL1PPCAC_20477, partial [Pristionchus entomophagus]
APLSLPSDAPVVFPVPVTVPAPVAEICPAAVTVCIADADCSPGDSCVHQFSNSDVFGCCHVGVAPLPLPSDAPVVFPVPVTVPAPVAEICPAAVTVCIADADCSPGDSCVHQFSNSDAFGCC